ncbi:vesicle-associated protein 2-2 [Quercus suber]|uniref:Vesicle-associated protein 2-2 n=1 Tax=Quercus suber TaxID=58331 RepID=A0AAW0KXR4_QUESU
MFTMQAQRTAPPDMVCKDNFLIQSTIVPVGTIDEDITPSMFAKDGSKCIEENKLRVTLISPPSSPELSPINGLWKQGLASSKLKKSQELGRVETQLTVPKDIDESKLFNEKVLNLAEDMESKTVKDTELKPAKDAELKPAEDAVLKPVKHAELKPVEDSELKPFLLNLEFRLKFYDEVPIENENFLHTQVFGFPLQAEVTISKLTEEKSSSIQDIRVFQEKLAELSKRGVRRGQVGFPLLFVCMVAIVSVELGYLLHR